MGKEHSPAGESVYSSEGKMKAVLKYPGAKNRIADWIIENMPKHDVYVEPFAGSLAALLNKPRFHIETVNDLYNNLLNGWRKVQKSTLAENGLKRTETLWMNYKEGQMSLFDLPEVQNE